MAEVFTMAWLESIKTTSGGLSTKPGNGSSNELNVRLTRLLTGFVRLRFKDNDMPGYPGRWFQSLLEVNLAEAKGSGAKHMQKSEDDLSLKNI